MKWIETLMWALCRGLGWALQLAGCAGLLLAGLIAVYAFASWLEG